MKIVLSVCLFVVGATPVWAQGYETHFDTTEETEVELVPLAEVPALVSAGLISHALVISAFYLLDRWRAGAGR